MDLLELKERNKNRSSSDDHHTPKAQRDIEQNIDTKIAEHLIVKDKS
jgi:hypothetical protein